MSSGSSQRRVGLLAEHLVVVLLRVGLVDDRDRHELVLLDRLAGEEAGGHVDEGPAVHLAAAKADRRLLRVAVDDRLDLLLGGVDAEEAELLEKV